MTNLEKGHGRQEPASRPQQMPRGPSPADFRFLGMTAVTTFWPERREYNSRMPATLSSGELAGLKARAHTLEPVCARRHAGVTPELVAEVDCALSGHELIKVTIAVEDRQERLTAPE
jgi:RNA-binding protein